MEMCGALNAIRRFLPSGGKNISCCLLNIKAWVGRNPFWASWDRQTSYACQESILFLPLVMWSRHYEEPFRHYCELRHEIHVRLRSDLFSNLPNVMFKADGNEIGMDVAVIRNDVSSVINQQ